MACNSPEACRRKPNFQGVDFSRNVVCVSPCIVGLFSLQNILCILMVSNEKHILVLQSRNKYGIYANDSSIYIMIPPRTSMITKTCMELDDTAIYVYIYIDIYRLFPTHRLFALPVSETYRNALMSLMSHALPPCCLNDDLPCGRM